MEKTLLSIEIDDSKVEGRILAGEYIVAKIYATTEGLVVDTAEGQTETNL